MGGKWCAAIDHVGTHPEMNLLQPNRFPVPYKADLYPFAAMDISATISNNNIALLVNLNERIKFSVHHAIYSFGNRCRKPNFHSQIAKHGGAPVRCSAARNVWCQIESKQAVAIGIFFQ